MPSPARHVAGTSDDPVEFRVLGSIEAITGGAPARLGGPRQRALLALLLLAAGRPVSTDRLVDDLWAGEPPDGADATLRSYVSRLRAALGPTAPITGDSGGYTLQVDPLRVDALRFEGLVRDAQADVEAGRRQRGRARLNEALALWGGAPFGGGGDGALASHAARLEELRVHGLEMRIDLDLEFGMAAELVDEIEAALRDHPFRERLWRQLMLALYRADRQADALVAYQRARDLLREELGLDPGEELERLQRAILRHEVEPAAPPQERNNLPQPLTTFVGRESVLAEVGPLLTGSRLLTLTGVGGVGKTRLALELARRALPDHRDGAWWVDLATLADPSLVDVQVAAALEIRQHQAQPLAAQLAQRLKDREVLLVLDNCEHLREACATLVERLLREAPGLRVLATSREPLGVPGETDYPVPPLALPVDPNDPDAIRASEAVALFLTRAREARPSLREDLTSLAAAARICADLDGLPLAVELAAARAKALSLFDIAARLEDRFRFLVSWRRLSSARHQTLREAMDWSFLQLGPDEQALLSGLSVFAGGFDIQAVASVLLAGDRDRAVELLQRLVDASLLVADTSGDATRYRMLETVRQYAAARLEGSGEADAVRRRHARHYRELVDESWRPIRLGGSPEWVDRLATEHDNLRAAVRWARDSGASDELLRLAEGLWWFWWVHGDVAEGRGWLHAALGDADGAAPELVAGALAGAAGLAWAAHDLDAAVELAQRARDGYLAVGNREYAAAALNTQALARQARGELDVAQSMFERCLDEHTDTEDELVRQARITTVHNLGWIAVEKGDEVRAAERFEQALAMSRAEAAEEGVAMCEWALSQLDVARGDLASATRRLGVALGHYRQMGFTHYLVDCLALAGCIGVARGNDRDALALLAAADALRERIGHDAWPYLARLLDAHLATLRGRLDDEAFRSAQALGTSLSQAAAADLAERSLSA